MYERRFTQKTDLYCLAAPDIRMMQMASQNQLQDVPESDFDSLDLEFCDPELPVGIRE